MERKLKENRRNFLSSILLFVVLILSACSSKTANVVEPVQETAEEQQQPDAYPSLEQAYPLVEVIPYELPPDRELEADLAPVLEETVQVEEAAPTVRPGLEATDPTSVQLVSGKVQLIEFFAFW